MDDRTDQSTSVLLLDRPRAIEDTGPSTALDPTGQPGTVDRPAPAPPAVAAPTADFGGGFGGPALGVVAAASILMGYRWLGVIPVTGGSHLSTLAFGRPGALVVAALVLAGLALPAAWTTGKTTAGAHRAAAQPVMVLTAAVAAAVAAILVSSDTTLLRYAFGVSELVVASVAGTLLIVDEYRRHRSGPTLRADRLNPDRRNPDRHSAAVD